MSTYIAPSANGPADKTRIVEAILDLEYPLWRVIRGIESAARQFSGKPAGQIAQMDQIAAREAELNALTLDQLKDRLAHRQQAKARADEARRFYNTPQAQAKFDYWLAMDFWTLDEAVALLLGKNPQVVNPASIDKDLEKPKGLFGGAALPPTRFTNIFKGLRLKAQRSVAMTHSERLTPLEVAHWGKSVLGSHLPAPLAALLAKAPRAALPLSVSVSVPVTEAVETESRPEIAATATATTTELRQPAAAHRTVVSKAALIALAPIWETVENDLHHAKRNGLAAAAKAEGRNQWWREAAIEWAIAKGKIAPRHAGAPIPSLPAGFFSR